MSIERVRIEPEQMILKDSSGNVVFDTNNNYVKANNIGNGYSIHIAQSGPSLMLLGPTTHETFSGSQASILLTPTYGSNTNYTATVPIDGEVWIDTAAYLHSWYNSGWPGTILHGEVFTSTTGDAIRIYVNDVLQFSAGMEACYHYIFGEQGPLLGETVSFQYNTPSYERSIVPVSAGDVVRVFMPTDSMSPVLNGKYIGGMIGDVIIQFSGHSTSIPLEFTE